MDTAHSNPHRIVPLTTGERGTEIERGRTEEGDIVAGKRETVTEAGGNDKTVHIMTFLYGLISFLTHHSLNL